MQVLNCFHACKIVKHLPAAWKYLMPYFCKFKMLVLLPVKPNCRVVHWIATAPEVLSNTVEMCGDFGCARSVDGQDSWPVSGAVDSKQSGSDRSWASAVIAKA